MASEATDWPAQEALKARRDGLKARIEKLKERKKAAEAAQEAEPHYLIVLCHGLSGTANDLNYLKRAIDNLATATTPSSGEGLPGFRRVLVHGSSCNVGKTFEGVEAAGLRLAEEVLSLVETFPRLQQISFVGHSLGGLLARYAIAVLYHKEGDAERVCSLDPLYFVTTVSPHLGEPNIKHVTAVLGQTGHDIALLPRVSEPPLLFQLCTTRTFLDPLAAFKRRRLYSNVQGDTMVPFWTAAIEIGENGDHNDGARILGRFTAKATRYEIGERGCEHELMTFEQEAFTVPEDSEAASSSAASQLVALTNAVPSQLTAMAQGLNSVGWSKVAVKLRVSLWRPHTWLPLAHARLIANERKGLLSLISSLLEDGQPVMDDLAKYVLGQG
eukprot:CAMPEP_0177714272 /NCGR_PEP_ID=MMETSP0484_2-20121128/13376_1 /TAXON_ID=354590 /ORGANISM="Rhodomonas lens, Strain RHODO" /LENGTH=385 /DNA_ID=CAMNT_0019226201 /DNA_START=26 /DNA_END=1183 /DNA_ORIENTATION=-